MPEQAQAAAAAAAASAATAAAVAAALAVQKEFQRVTDLERRMRDAEDALAADRKALAAINTAADRWKGGFLLAVAFGGVITWLASVGGSIKGMFK